MDWFSWFVIFLMCLFVCCNRCWMVLKFFPGSFAMILYRDVANLCMAIFWNVPLFLCHFETSKKKFKIRSFSFSSSHLGNVAFVKMNLKIQKLRSHKIWKDEKLKRIKNKKSSAIEDPEKTIFWKKGFPNRKKNYSWFSFLFDRVACILSLFVCR